MAQDRSDLTGAAHWALALNKSNGNWVPLERLAWGELRSRAGGLAFRGRKVPVGDQQPGLQARRRARGCWKERHVGGGGPES